MSREFERRVSGKPGLGADAALMFEMDVAAAGVSETQGSSSSLEDDLFNVLVRKAGLDAVVNAGVGSIRDLGFEHLLRTSKGSYLFSGDAYSVLANMGLVEENDDNLEWGARQTLNEAPFMTMEVLPGIWMVHVNDQSYVMEPKELCTQCEEYFLTEKAAKYLSAVFDLEDWHDSDGLSMALSAYSDECVDSLINCDSESTDPNIEVVGDCVIKFAGEKLPHSAQKVGDVTVISSKINYAGLVPVRVVKDASPFGFSDIQFSTKGLLPEEHDEPSYGDGTWMLDNISPSSYQGPVADDSRELRVYLREEHS